MISLASLIAALGWSLPDLWRHWELLASGVAMEWRGLRPLSAPVTMVVIDDFSLQQAANADLSHDPLLRELQQWPWPRAVYARLLDRLYSAGALAVGLDLMFDTASSHGARDDDALAAALRRYSGRTILAAMVLESKGDSAGLSLALPITPLAEAAGSRAIGLLNGPLERDGSIRRRPGDYSSLLRPRIPAIPPGIGEAMLLATGRRDSSKPPAVDGTWLALLDLHGPPRTVTTIPIWDLLEEGSYRNLLDSGRLRHQLVLVGTSAAVFQDLHRSPFSGGEGMPGVELHATELSNRLEGRTLWLWQPGRWWGLVLGLLALVVGLLAERWERPMVRLAVLGGITVLLALLAQLGVALVGIAPNLFGSAMVVGLVAVVSSGDASVRMQWKRWRLRQALSRYLSPAVAAEIASQPVEADGLLGGRSTEVVLLMTDIRGFTSRTRQMSDVGRARELVDQLNTYFSEVVDALHGEGGTVDKFIGDAALAVFGAPIHRGSRVEAAAALRAALDIQRRIEQLNQRWLAEGVEPWQQVIVLHYGPVISGNVGSVSRMDYTVIGDGVNAASRLEAVAKQCNCELVMSSAFIDLLDQNDSLVPLGQFDLRGHGVESVFSWQKASDSA